MESLDVRAATLDALRRWAATDRASLVAAAWEAGNRNVSELARTARVGRDAIYADLRVKGIDPTASREEPAVMPTTDAAVDLPVPGWRHPHLVTLRRSRTVGGSLEFAIKPFTGREPEPKIPQEWDGARTSVGDDEREWELRQQRRMEINLVRSVWARARFTHQVGELLAGRGDHPYRSPADDWQAYVAARDELRAAYAALTSTPDDMWRAALLRIVDAKRRAEEAASRWDDRGEQIEELQSWVSAEIHGVSYWTFPFLDAAKEHGVDATDWLIGSAGEYHDKYCLPPAQYEIKKMIKEGDERIRQVQALSAKGRH